MAFNLTVMSSVGPVHMLFSLSGPLPRRRIQGNKKTGHKAGRATDKLHVIERCDHRTTSP
jgi:hypothetical protein